MSRGIFLVRHGNTFESGEAPRRIGSGTDLPLTGAGRAQAQALAAYFTALGVKFDRVLTGPLSRTRETAAIIAGDAEIADWLVEVDHGPDEGKPEADVTARLGAEALERWDRLGEAPDDWVVDAPGRLAAWQQFFADQPPEGAALLVTSNGAARFALLAIGMPMESLKLRTGAYGEIVIEDGRTTVARWDARPGE